MGVHLKLPQTIKASNALKELATVFAEEQLSDQESANRLSKVVEFPITANNIRGLKRAMGLHWKMKRVYGSPENPKLPQLYVIVDSLIDMHKQLGMAVTPELKVLYDDLKAERNHKSGEEDAASSEE